MPRYTIDTYTSKVRRQDANSALLNMTDDEILARITQPFLPVLAPFDDERIWDEDEPEHAGLASAIRTQAIRDLDVLFSRADDAWCDNVLGNGYDILTGLPGLCVVYDNEDDDMEDVESYRNANPVNRLRALRICEKPAETIPEVDGSGYTTGIRGAINPRRVAYTPIEGTYTMTLSGTNGTATNVQWFPADATWGRAIEQLNQDPDEGEF